jgi:malonyl CoA-acyl carrier protein transacylase
MRAALFPGQGSQTADMPLDTAGQQPAVFEASVASFAEAGVQCEFFAGHSLGSYAALVAAGALDADAGRRIVTVRGQAMSDAGRANQGAMVALLGCGIDVAREVAERFGLTVANDNAPGQVVISGELASVEQAEAAEPTFTDTEGRERKIRMKRLAVSGAFHSPLMEPAAERLAEALAAERFGDGTRAIANGTARPFVDPATELARELLMPVRWRESLEYLWQQGVREFVEFEPAGVLTGLVKRTLPEAQALKITDLVAAES